MCMDGFHGPLALPARRRTYNVGRTNLWPRFHILPLFMLVATCLEAKMNDFTSVRNSPNEIFIATRTKPRLSAGQEGEAWS